jgi:hypothetical protein
MEILKGILIAVSILPAIIMFASIIVCFPVWKDYKRFYKKLPTLIFLPIDKYGFGQISDTTDTVIWFTDDNSFKIGKGNYIHDSFFTYFDPYSLYWLIKYKKWFKQNCSHLKEIKKEEFADWYYEQRSN